MAIQFHELKVIKVVRRTKEAVSIYFDIPSELIDEFSYKPGQYITIKLDNQGIKERRAYSISTSPLVDSELAVTVKEVRAGKVSPWLNNVLKQGTVLEVMPPLGNFTTEINSDNKKNYVFYAGGSGITPIISLIKSILSVERESKIQLYYANTDVNSIIFKDELNELFNLNNNFKLVHILDNVSDEVISEKGRLTPENCRNLLTKDLTSFDLQNAEYFICGPSGFMNQVEIALDELQVNKKQIHKESFTIEENNSTKIQSDSSIENKVRKVKVHIYGEEHTIEVKPDETILMAGIRQSLDPPFSCQIGACATCQAKVLKGKVEMEADDALMEEDKIDGYVLTCTSHPVTDDVEIDFDY
jgi:ring-1,2-phenylacetyl-CoA epoxidase subunit PaaE